MSDSPSVLHRHPKTRNFTQIENDTIRDNRLSFRATGLLIYLLSLPHGSRIASEALVGRKKEKRDSIRTAYNELREFGYVHRERKQQPDGRWTTIIHVYEVPTTENQASVFQSSENRASETSAVSLAESKTDEKDGEIATTCPICCDRFTDLDEFESHYTDCSDPEFQPASKLTLVAKAEEAS